MKEKFTTTKLMCQMGQTDKPLHCPDKVIPEYQLKGCNALSISGQLFSYKICLDSFHI